VNAAVQHQELLPILFWKLFRKDSLMLRRTLSPVAAGACIP
jgi:hypothetical protein